MSCPIFALVTPWWGQIPSKTVQFSSKTWSLKGWVGVLVCLPKLTSWPYIGQTMPYVCQKSKKNQFSFFCCYRHGYTIATVLQTVCIL